MAPTVPIPVPIMPTGCSTPTCILPPPPPPKCSTPKCKSPKPLVNPVPVAPKPMATYNNYGSGGAGSYNFGRKRREAQWGSGAVNYGSNFGHMYGRKKREAQTTDEQIGESSSTSSSDGATYNNYGSGGIGSINFYYDENDNTWKANPSSLPTSNSPKTFNNNASGGAGSYNFDRKKREAQYGPGAVNYGNNYGHMYGRKKREAQTYINHGSGGAGSTNYNYGSSYNNFGSGGAGSSNHNHHGGSFNYGSNFGSMWG